jgi:hypothetical protein
MLLVRGKKVSRREIYHFQAQLAVLEEEEEEERKY